MDKLLLIGAGGFGRVVLEAAERQYECAFVDDGLEARTTVCGIPVVGHLADLAELRKHYDNVIVTIGNNKLREKIYSDIKALHFSCPNIVSPSAFISKFASIGCGCVILNNAVIQNGAMVGNGVLVNSGVEIGHDSSVDDNSIVYANTVIRTGAKVGKRARIGSNATIGNNVLVPDDADVKNGMALE